MTVLADATTKVVQALVDDILATLDGIPDDDLASWLPAAAENGGGEMNTFAAIAIHTASAARWMLNHQVLGQDHPRDRDAEFHAVATREEIDRLYDTWMTEMTACLARLDDIDLTALPPTPRDSRPGWTRADWLLHIVEHTGLHLGHLQVQRQLWEAERSQ